MRKNIILTGFSLFFFLFFLKAEGAVGINSSGDWTLTVGALNLTGGAGTDLTSSYQSLTTTTSISITGAAGANWRVDVKRTDATWDSNFHIFVQRTSNGTGSGTISGGTSYIEATATNTQFFTGSGNRSGINVQYQLTGMSLNVAPNPAYNTTVTFTVTQTP